MHFTGAVDASAAVADEHSSRRTRAIDARATHAAVAADAEHAFLDAEIARANSELKSEFLNLKKRKEK